MTANLSGDVPSRGRERLQFSLGGLMVLTFGVAVGLSAATLKGTIPTDGLFAAAAAWIVLGLASQAFDLWRTFHGRADLPSDVRWGWRFAMLWRLGIACLLVGSYFTNALLRLEVVSLPEVTGDLFPVGVLLRKALFYLLLIVVVWSVPHACRERKASWWSKSIDALAGAAATLWCLIMLSQMTIVTFLVHLALGGIAAIQVGWLTDRGASVYGNAQSRHFFWCSLFATAFVLLNTGLSWQLARQWTRGLRRRLIWAGLLLPSLAVPAGYIFWLERCGLRATSPHFAEVQALGPGHRWVTAVVLLIVLITAATYRAIGDRAHASREPPGFQWRKRPRGYYHERLPLLMFSVFVVVAVFALLSFVTLVTVINSLSPSAASAVGKSYDGSFSSWAGLLEWIVGEPQSYFMLALALVSFRRAYGIWFRPVDPAMIDPPRLRLGQFCAVWLALFATALFGIPTLAALSFGVWLSPWYRLPWP